MTPVCNARDVIFAYYDHTKQERSKDVLQGKDGALIDEAGFSAPDALFAHYGSKTAPLLGFLR
jgi:hypothetical protein